MKRFLIISGALLFLLAGAIYLNPNQFFTKMYLRISGYYKTPQFESRQSILAQVKSSNLQYDRLYRLKNIFAYEDLSKRKMMHVPFVYIYNRDKNMLSVASGNECSWTLMNFFDTMDTTKLKAGDSEIYNFITERLDPIDIKSDMDTFDYYVHAGWANYLPKLSNALFKQTNEIMETHQGKVCLSYIDLDHQEEWMADMDSIQSISNKQSN